MCDLVYPFFFAAVFSYYFPFVCLVSEAGYARSGARRWSARALMTSRAPPPDTRLACSLDEYALVCYLRLNPAIAKTYGIKECVGKTTVGSMLQQVLEALGMHVNWHKRLPIADTALQQMKAGNAKGSVWIQSLTRRPGAHMKQLKQQPKVAPPPDAAVTKNGRPRASLFPQLKKLSNERRKKSFSTCGNLFAPPSATALVEVRISSQLSRSGVQACIVVRATTSPYNSARAWLTGSNVVCVAGASVGLSKESPTVH